MAAASWQRSMAPLLERRVGPRKIALDATVAPATQWNPGVRRRQRRPGARSVRPQHATRRAAARQRRGHRVRAGDPALALDRAEGSSRSERLTNIYLQPHRAVRSEAALRHHAHAGRRAGAGEEGRRGNRGGQVSRAAARHSVRREGSARHGRHRDDLRRRAVPEPRARPPTPPSCARLNEAGAVLIAKLSLGALALNDIWFGGQTMNPWLLEEGASGSSAGPGAATAAALVAFSIGSETGGSIVSPAMRCGVTGLRPDVRARAAHRRHDALLVARQARADDTQRRGRDARPAGDHRTGPRRRVERAEPSRLRCDRAGRPACASATFRAWMKENPATDVDRAALETVEEAGDDDRPR